MGFNLGRLGIAAGTLGLSELAGEDAMSNIPVLGTLGGYKSDEEKALLAKQEEMAREAKKRQQQNEQMRMQALGQSLLAFNPRNQMMAQMFGPQAAFSPEQFAQMAQNPNGPPQLDPSLVNYRGNDQGKAAQVAEWAEKKKAWDRQQNTIMQGMAPVGPGPAPISMPRPQAARKF